MGLTITEKILANASHKSEVTSGEVAIADIDIVMAHGSTAPLAIEGFYEIEEKVSETGQIHDKTKGLVLKAKPLPEFIRKIVERGGLVNFLRSEGYV